LFIRNRATAGLPVEGYIVFRAEGFVGGFLRLERRAQLVWSFHVKENRKAGGRSKSKGET
jgi:hypothetical protein